MIIMYRKIRQIVPLTTLAAFLCYSYFRSMEQISVGGKRNQNNHSFYPTPNSGNRLMDNARARGVYGEEARTRSPAENSLPTSLSEKASIDGHDRYDDTSKISRIYLLGERNSGTKFIEKALYKAFPSYGSHHGSYPLAKDIPVFGFKHMFRHRLLDRLEMKQLQSALAGNNNDFRGSYNTPNGRALFVLVVRSPCEWADGMRRIPWHMCPSFGMTNSTNDKKQKDPCTKPYIGLDARNQTSRMSLEEFVQIPWYDFREKDAKETDYSYENVFALRTFKLKLMAQVLNASTTNTNTTSINHPVMIIRMRDFEASPSRVIQEMVQRFGLRTNPNYDSWGGVERIVLPTPFHKQHKAICVSQKTSDLAHAALDWELEQQFGFSPNQECQPCLQSPPPPTLSVANRREESDIIVAGQSRSQKTLRSRVFQNRYKADVSSPRIDQIRERRKRSSKYSYQRN